MQNSQPHPGQRWVSDSEPELGLGIILRVGAGRVEILFPAAEERRLYALSSSPLRRVAFKVNDRIRTHDGSEGLIQKVEEEEGRLIYHTSQGPVKEGELADTISFSSPKERLMAGQISKYKTYKLRTEALERWSTILGSPVRGYIGGRVDLIPHQLSIAGDVCSRLVPRVLLADEVGLGKTIEAGLILHRLHLTGRADRILILLPEPLVHQWFVEMLRRFNLPFNIVDEERCEAIEEHQPGVNPFLEYQLVLCSIGTLAENEDRAAQALEAGWDMLVVDEAHHLEWSREDSGTEYNLVEALAAKIPGVLLLTATPQQLGPEGHFARLRLLDPDRYVDLDPFLEETKTYEQVAQAVDRLLEGKGLTDEDQEMFAHHSERVQRRLEELSEGKEGAKEALINDLLDSFGTGRVMFRNTRSALSGFPERKAWLERVEASAKDEQDKVMMNWLTGFLKKLGDEKALLICRTREKAEEIYKYLQLNTKIKPALFHEGLMLVQRDRNAAYFAEEDGAQVLVCSEIGSEGRNFQFAHHLILFDLPLDPDLLQQRIGRLDRIGQTATVEIHVPYLPGTESEVLARWYHEGLNAFEESLQGGAELSEMLHDDLQALLQEFNEEKLSAFIEQTSKQRDVIVGKLANGYDRLLALSSNKPEQAAEAIDQIREADKDLSFEQFFNKLLEYYGVQVEEIGPRSWLFRPDFLTTDKFPALPEDGLHITFDRNHALVREDLEFISRDHPFVRSVMELFLEGEDGNTVFSVWERPGREGIILEATIVIECIAPPNLHIHRFLPPTPVTVIVDDMLTDLTDSVDLEEAPLKGGDIHTLLDRRGVKTELLPPMFEAVDKLATDRMETIVQEAIDSMTEQLDGEIERLEDLSRMNSNVNPEEVEALREREAFLRNAISTARLRTEALRLVARKAPVR